MDVVGGNGDTYSLVVSLAASSVAVAWTAPEALESVARTWRAVSQHWELLALAPGARVMALVWGLLWGSFANVVIARLPLEESVVRGRSRCGSCGAGVRWYDNIPVVSYLLLRGACRSCKARFSARYLVVELSGGVLSLAIYMKVVVAPLLLGDGSASLFRWLALFSLALALVIIIFIDIDYWFIPDEIVLPGVLVGLGAAYLGLSAAPQVWWHGLAAGAVGLGLFAGLRWLYIRFRDMEALGLGDAKLLLMLGPWLGPMGLVWTIGAGAVQGILVSVPLAVTGRSMATRSLEEVAGDDPLLAVSEDDEDRVMAQRVPFGPFLAVAALEWILLRETIEEGLFWLVATLPLGG